MSKKVGAVPEETKARLISSATEEFRKNGYEKTSLRSICKNADVTTGALYFFFKGKDELFEKVLYPITRVVHSIGRDFTPILLDEDYSSMERFIDFYYDNIGLYEIIWNNQNKPVVKAYLSRVRNEFFNQVSSIVDNSENVVMLIDETTLRWTVDVIYLSVLQLVTLDLDREKAKKHIISIMKMFRKGSFSIESNTGNAQKQQT